MERQHVLKEELINVLHGLHLFPLRLETTLQQEAYAATQLILVETRRAQYVKINQNYYLHMQNKMDVHTLLFEAYCRSSNIHTHTCLASMRHTM